MDKDYEKKYHANEENNWWFRARRDIIFRLLTKFDKNSKILDVGCSGGPLLLEMKNRGFDNNYGVDISTDAISLCKKRGLQNVFVSDATKLNFQDNEFDIVIASDVLEHIKDDQSAISEWNRVLRPGGILFVFVPAFNSLWSEHDILNQHFRRYSKKSLVNLVSNNGFIPVKNSYWNFLLFFPNALWRYFLSKIFKIKEKDQLHEGDGFLNKMLFFLLKLENWLVIHVNFPVGISVFVIAKKNQSQN